MENVSWLNPVSGQVFATTRWTVIAACKEPDHAKAQLALTELCQAYWQPVYACIRHHGYSVHDAQDLTQDFFVRLLNGRWLQHLDAAKGRFRAYLSTALHNFLREQWRRRWTLRRGRGHSLVHFDTQEAEGSYAALIATQTTPESLYEYHWATTVIDATLEQLRIEMRAAGREALLAHFDAIMATGTRAFPFEETARSLGLETGALHVALHRCRQRFHTLIREEIARTVASKAEIEAELLHLQRVVAQAR